MEEELYEAEGIDYGKVGFVDNSPVLGLLERKAAGLLPILDEAVVMPGGSDSTFYRKLATAHGTSPLLTMLSKGDDGERLAFEVSHYAGIVMYDAQGFCDKNGDKVLADQRDAVLTSASPLVTALFDERPDLDRAPSSMLSPAPGSGGGGPGGEPEFLWQKAPKGPPRVGSVFANSSSGGSSVSEASRRGSVQTPARAGAKTIAAHFSKQLASLMASLDATAPQFVRCIKPNALKTAGILQPQLVLEQLRYSGVFEATAIKKSGFPFRATHQAFVARYRCAADPEELGQYSPTRKASEADWSAEARKVLAALPNRLGDETRLRLGKTMVLWRVKEHEQLELLRNLAVEGRAGQVQTAARAFLARKLRRAAAAARAACDAAVAASDVDALTAALDLARALPTEYAWCRAAATLRARLEAERRVLAAFTELTPQDAEVVFEPLSAALAEYDGLGDDFKAAHSELHSKAKTMIDGVARRFEARAALKMIIDRAKLEHGLALAAELRMWDGRDAATAASPADQELLGMAVVALQRIIAEEKINGELRAALYGDGKLEWSGASEPALDRCSCAALQTSLAASEEFGARTADGLFLQEAARAALGVRSAVLAAGGGDWSDGARKGIDEALLACADLHAKVEELAAAAAAVAVRAQVREVSTQLGLSMQVLHHEALAMALQRATALDMGSVPEFAPTVAAAVALDAKLTEVRGGLRAGIESVDRAALGLALDGAAELGLAHYEQPAAAHLAAEIERLLEAAAAALDSMDPSDLGAVLGEADALRLREPPIEKVRETLGLPAERFLSEQLKAAKRHGDIPREDALNTAIKDLIFERSGDAFDLAKLPRLRTADEFANAKMGGKKERREGFLRHQAKPIPTSLTQLDSKEKREEAVATFKSILGYMGDAPYQFPIMLAVELVTKALSGGAELQVTGCHCHHRHRLLLHCHHLHLTSSTIPSADRGVRPADETAEP